MFISDLFTKHTKPTSYKDVLKHLYITDEQLAIL